MILTKQVFISLVLVVQIILMGNGSKSFEKIEPMPLQYLNPHLCCGWFLTPSIITTSHDASTADNAVSAIIFVNDLSMARGVIDNASIRVVINCNVDGVIVIFVINVFQVFDKHRDQLLFFFVQIIRFMSELQYIDIQLFCFPTITLQRTLPTLFLSMSCSHIFTKISTWT